MSSFSVTRPVVSQAVAAPAESTLCASRISRATFSREDELNTSTANCFHGGIHICLQGPVLKTRTSTQRHSDHFGFSQNGVQGVKQNPSTIFRSGIFTQVVPTHTEESALIEVEDETDGSIIFKYGGSEDMLELDKMLEFLCRGAFNTYGVESLVPRVLELPKIPISASGQRQILELLSSYVRTNRNVVLCEIEKAVSQILAETTSEFLSPATTGHYRGRRRPRKMFSARVDKWWQKVDSFLSVVEDDLEFWGDDEFKTSEPKKFLAEPLSMNKILPNWNDHGCRPLKAVLSGPVENVQSRFTWRHTTPSVDWVSDPAKSLVSEAPKSLEFVTELNSSYRSPGGKHRAGAGFLLLSSQINTLEAVLKRSEPASSSCHTDVRRRPLPSFSETLPVSSIQDMIEWEQEQEIVTRLSVPNKKGQSKKAAQSNQRSRARSSHQRFQSRAGDSRSATKKCSNSEKLHELFDIFFTLPLNHSNSGVANFLKMRKGLSNELLVVLNQGSVVLLGGGLAVFLHVAARMLSINSTFDHYQLFRLIRGAALIWLSVAMQRLRSVLLFLPPECTVSNYRDKKQLLSLQHQLSHLSFKALTVIVLSVVGTGV